MRCGKRVFFPGRQSTRRGVWRSWLARMHGVHEVAGSSPATPTERSTMIKKNRKGKIFYELTKEECRQLNKAADDALKNTYPTGGDGFSVAVMTESGSIYTGVSYISKTQTLTMHSEATALAHAAIHGEKRIVAITGPNCHICKQLIYESSLHSGIDVNIVIEEADGIKQVPISELMPYPWPEK